MPRPPRIFEPGCMYHLTPKGNDGRRIFVDDEDRFDFLRRLAAVVRRYGLVILGYCLMDNHVHFVIVVHGGGVSDAMRVLLGGYSRSSNRRHGRRGHLFENHFHDEPICSDRHLVAALRYVDLNPVNANMEARPSAWRWSSYRAHIGLDNPPTFLANDDFLRLLGRTPQLARSAYSSFVREGVPGVSWPPPPRPPHIS